MADENDRSLIRSLGAAAGGLAASGASRRVVEPLVAGIPTELAHRHLRRLGPPVVMPTGLWGIPGIPLKEKAVLSDIAKKRGITPVGSPFVGPGGYLDPKLPSLRRLPRTKRLLLPRSPVAVVGRGSTPIMLHELGHGKPLLGSHRLRRGLQELVVGTRAARAKGLIGQLAMAGILAGDPGGEGLHKSLYDKAPHLIAATSAPMLLEELRASTNAIIDAKRKSLGAARTLKAMALPFGAYLGAAAAPVATAVIAKKVVEMLRGVGTEKTARVAGAEVKAPGSLRTPASSAWRIGGTTPPKPKTDKPGQGLSVSAKTKATAKPPSNKKYYRDVLSSMYSPQRGYRLSVA